MCTRSVSGRVHFLLRTIGMERSIKQNNRTRLKLDVKRMGYLIVALGILCVGMISRQAYWYLSLKNELTQTSSRVEILQQKKQKLQAEKEALGKLEQVERVARDQYNMVKPNEIPVFIVGEESKDK